MRLFILLFNTLFFFACRQNSSQPVATPALHNTATALAAPLPKPEKADASNLKSFVPAGYELLDTASGDLNGDAFPDWILVLKKPEEEATSDVIEHPEKRPLLILTGAAGGTLKQVARNENAVYCVDCGGMMGDPYQGITIKNGYFSVEHYGGSAWRWTHIITFKWSGADSTWLLYKQGGDRFHTFEPEKVETEVKTQKDFGKVPFENFDIYSKEN